MPNRVTVMRWIGILTVRPAIGWNDAVWITGNVFVQEDPVIGLLTDSTRRSDPRSARFTTVEDRIQFALVVGKLLYLRLKFRFVGRRRSRRQRTGDVGLYRPAAACINLFDLNLAIDFLFQGGWRQIDGKEPQSAQVRMSGCRFLRTSQRGKQQSCHHDRKETIHLLVLLFCVGLPLFTAASYQACVRNRSPQIALVHRLLLRLR